METIILHTISNIKGETELVSQRESREALRESIDAQNLGREERRELK